MGQKSAFSWIVYPGSHKAAKKVLAKARGLSEPHLRRSASEASGWWQNSFPVALSFMASCFFKVSTGRLSKMCDALLGDCVNAVAYIPLPLLHCIA